MNQNAYAGHLDEIQMSVCLMEVGFWLLVIGFAMIKTVAFAALAGHLAIRVKMGFRPTESIEGLSVVIFEA